MSRMDIIFEWKQRRKEIIGNISIITHLPTANSLSQNITHSASPYMTSEQFDKQ